MVLPEKQIKLLTEIKDSLHSFATQLEEDSLEYAKKVDNITVNGGLIEDIAGDFYTASLFPTQKKIEEIVEKIKTRDERLIENEIAFQQKGKANLKS
jgi:hypothetical protein